MRHVPDRDGVAARRSRLVAPLSGALPLEIAFLERWLPDRAVLVRAAETARATGSCPARELIASGAFGEAVYYVALARHLGVPFVDRWPRASATLDPGRAVAIGRLRVADRPSWLLAPEGRDLRVLVAAHAAGLALPTIAVTTPSRLRALAQLEGEWEIAFAASEGLPDAAPPLSAKRALRGRRRYALFALPACALLGLVLAWRFTTALFGALFFASMVLRLMTCAAGLGARPRTAPPLVDARLPDYTVLVPLRHETDVLHGLVAALDRLDYPRAKLDVMFLVEPEDHATRTTLAALALPPWIRVVLGPRDEGALRTKPRALNVGLLFARGSLLTVFDAEDRPEPNQLRAAASAFVVAPARVACLQARLAISNGGRSWLARTFALEYAALFDVFNIGVAAWRLPMALGGTSNHFRTAALRKVGGWDAWNVTEDADLGLRFARFGYDIESLDSTTYEEAPEHFGDWMKQRQRWTKGWMQTLLVLALDLPAASRDLGPSRAIAIALMLTNLVTGPLLLPVFSVCVVWHVAQGGFTAPHTPLDLIETTLAASVLGLGLVSTLWQGLAGHRQRFPSEPLVTILLLLPYQLMISVAAWLGLIDLGRRPFHWHKTRHGRAARRGLRARAARST